jgi:endogenous inhibitor of DNA gyrase (YacG/DUF329 family)
MSEKRLEVRCPRCQHSWYVNLAELDLQNQTVYKGVTYQRRYNLPCPRCGTRVVVTVTVEEGEHGQSADR